MSSNFVITSCNHALDTSPGCWGELRQSMDIIDDAPALRERMAADGYLYLPGYLDPEAVLAARQTMAQRLADEGFVDPRFPLLDLVANEDSHLHFKPDLAHDNAALHRLLYQGRMMHFFKQLLDGEVRHFDFTWIRAVSPGAGTAPHCDHVYMGRGTDTLFTAWTPIGDVPLEMGGLMVLENSHLIDRLRSNYCTKDVDRFCTNRRGDDYQMMGGGGNIRMGGSLSHNPRVLRERLGGRWLTNEYDAGDLLVFSTYLVHASLDNHSDRIRISTDTRYQLASEPADERWIGENPIAHGPEAKRGMIC